MTECRFELSLVKNRIARACDRGGELVRVTGLDVTGCVAGDFGNCLSEVIPRNRALVGIMIDALIAFKCASGDDVGDGIGEVLGIGRSADLVKHYFQLRFGRRQIKHCLDEVFAIFAVKPSSAQDNGLAARLFDGFFAVQLGHAVDPRRTSIGILGARGISRQSSENIVGRHMNQPSVTRSHCLGKIGSSSGIELFGKLRVALCTVYIGISRTVHNQVYSLVGHHLLDSLLIGDVKFCHIGKDVAVIRPLGSETQRCSQLPVGSRYKNIHRMMIFRMFH